MHIWAWFGEEIYWHHKWWLFRAACLGAYVGRRNSWFRAVFSSTYCPGGTPEVSLLIQNSQLGCCEHMCVRDTGHAHSPAWHPLSFQSLCGPLQPLPSLVGGVHTLGSTRRSLLSASVPHAKAGASQRQPHSSADLSLPERSHPGSMRAYGPSSDQAKAVKLPGGVTSTPRKKLVLQGWNVKGKGEDCLSQHLVDVFIDLSDFVSAQW